jgi:hypothetical protein
MIEVIHAIVKGTEYKLVKNKNECNNCDLKKGKNNCFINEGVAYNTTSFISQCVFNTSQCWKKTGNRLQKKK